MAASSPKLFSVFFLLLLFSAFQVRARESKFFSKIFRHSVSDDPNAPHTKIQIGPTPVPPPDFSPPSHEFELPPAPAPEQGIEVPVPAPAPIPGADTLPENGFGLYGQEEGSNEQFPSTKKVPATAGAGFENEILTEEFDDEDEELMRENDNNNHNGYYSTEKNDNGNGKYYSGPPVTKNYYYGNNGGYERKSTTERQGMSDTRFLENGRYFHDVKNENNENYYNGYDQTAERGSRNDQFDRTAERNSKYVFDSMEEYEKYQESHGYEP